MYIVLHFGFFHFVLPGDRPMSVPRVLPWSFFFFPLLQLHNIMLCHYTVTCLTDSLLVHTWIDSSLLLLQALL